MTHFADGVTIGRINKNAGPLVGPNGMVYVITPATLDRDGFCAAQQLGAAGDLLLNGALVTGGVGIADVPRRVGIYSAADLSLITFTIYGYDMLGRKVVASIAGPNNSTVQPLKAIKRLVRVAASAAVGSNVEVGTVDVFQFPRRISSAARVLVVKWDSTLADNAATVTAAVATSPSTISTGDTMGVIVAAGNAADGVRELAMWLAPDFTSELTEFGVVPYGDGIF